ncbi:MAG: PAS domain-containing protein, partial [Rikenellaceae bacterium]|nr:PAS domain-containing protein [Rikenellaceae bacterium]
MLNFRVTFKLLAMLLLLVASSVATLLLVQREYYTLAVFSAVILVSSLTSIIRFNNRNARKLMFMFSSIENGDYSFKFTVSGRNRHNTLVNQSLNRIHELLTKARDETIEQEKYFQLILESVTTGIVIINERGNVTQTNREAIRLLGIEPFTHIAQLSRLDERFPALMREIEAGESRQLTCNNERGSVTLS